MMISNHYMNILFLSKIINHLFFLFIFILFVFFFFLFAALFFFFFFLQFSSIGITFRNLYWSFYGYLAPLDYKLIVGNAGPNQEPTEHFLTNYAGEITIATFHIAVIMTLLNLMISMLVKTADTVLVSHKF